MDRRAFVRSVALGLLAAPITAEAQDARKVYLVGLLGSGVPPSAEARARSSFAPKARELRWIVGWNIVFEERWAEGKLERPPQLAADLVSTRVDVVVASGTSSTLAAKQATQTIPIVFVAHFLVEKGIVKSLARPGSNLTGIAIHVPLLKHLELLKQSLPGATQVTYLTDPAVWPQSVAGAWTRIEAGALMLNVKLQRVFVQQPQDIESAFPQFKRNHPHASGRQCCRHLCWGRPALSACDEAQASHHRRLAPIRGSGVPLNLRGRVGRGMASGCNIRGQDSQGDEARRPRRRAARQVRTCH
jgi:putative ABC transport system substrate-binding protein